MFVGDSFNNFVASMVDLNYILQTRTVEDNFGVDSYQKSWGVTAVDHGSIPSSMKSSLMNACLRVPRIRDLATNHRDDRFFHLVFINRMCDQDTAEQERLVSTAQHGWHTDGIGGNDAFMTVVYTLYDNEQDSSALSAHEVGGIVGMSNMDDGRFRRASLNQPETPKAKTTTVFFPKTNSLYIFPGYFVSHAVFKVKPGSIRYSVVMFVRLKRTIMKNKVDHVLREEWALSGDSNKSVCCQRCWSTFVDDYGLSEHKRRPPKKCIDVASLPH